MFPTFPLHPALLCRTFEGDRPAGCRASPGGQTMITMLGSPRRCCDGLTRRETLKAGGLSLFGGMTLPNLLRAEESRAFGHRPGDDKSVSLLSLLGGAATQDMWDLKPNAPEGTRSEFKPAATSAPGVQ